jgi:hypothetical protein
MAGEERGKIVRAKRDTSGYQPIKLEPEATQCAKCGGALRHGYRSDRHVAFLANRREILYSVLRCPNPACDGSDNRYIPQALHIGMLPKYEYGLDVIAFIGHERLRRHLKFADIGHALRHDHGVPIADRTVQDLFDLYLAMTSIPITEDPARLQKLRAQGKIVLSIDAAQPQMDQDALWALRDVLSGEVLKAFSAASMDAATLAGHLREVKALGVPVTGIISDAQNIIVQAVAKVFPGVPHQLCRIHFLRDFAKLVTDADEALKTDLAKHLKGLAPFQRAAAENPPQSLKEGLLRAPKSVTLSEEAPRQRPRPGRPRLHVALKPPATSGERTLVRTVCELLRAVLKNHGRYPLEAPGLETRDMLKQVLDALDEGLKQGGLDFFCCVNGASP